MEYLNFFQAVDILEQQYEQLVFKTLKVRNITEPVYMMPQPVPPHYRGDIVISASKDYPTDQEYHYHDYFVVFYAYRGDYVFNIMGEDITLREGDVTLFQPMVGHSIITQKNKDNILLTIRMRKSLLFQSLLPVMPKNDLLLDFFLSPFWASTTEPRYYLSFSPEEPAHASMIRYMIEIIVQEYVNMLPGYDSLLDSACSVLFSALTRCAIRQNSNSKAFSVTTKILQYINRNCANITLEHVANHFSYNPSYLSTLLRQETGQTFSDILRSSRLHRVCALLENSDISIENIAQLSGYPHNSYFYKTFKTVFGVTPSQYREMSQNKLKSMLPE